jgi:hypothetical protein
MSVCGKVTNNLTAFFNLLETWRSNKNFILLEFSLTLFLLLKQMARSQFAEGIGLEIRLIDWH